MNTDNTMLKNRFSHSSALPIHLAQRSTFSCSVFYLCSSVAISSSFAASRVASFAVRGADHASLPVDQVQVSDGRTPRDFGRRASLSGVERRGGGFPFPLGPGPGIAGEE